VGDEKNIRDVLRAFFEFQGFEVFEAADGMEASQKIREEPPFDVVLTDLRMPGTDGLQVLKVGRSVSPETAVLIFTGYSSRERESSAVKLGRDGFLGKPFRLDHLKSMIYQSLTKRKGERMGVNR
jgi:DNA-binding NtrC family response regulator